MERILAVKKALANIYGILLSSLFMVPFWVRADFGSNGGGGTSAPSSQTLLINPLNANTIGQLVTQLLNVVSILIIPVAIFFLVRAGFYFVTAGGNDVNLTKAKQNFIWVVTGLALILGAQLIGAIIENTITPLTR